MWSFLPFLVLFEIQLKWKHYKNNIFSVVMNNSCCYKYMHILNFMPATCIYTYIHTWTNSFITFLNTHLQGIWEFYNIEPHNIIKRMKSLLLSGKDTAAQTDMTPWRIHGTWRIQGTCCKTSVNKHSLSLRLQIQVKMLEMCDALWSRNMTTENTECWATEVKY